MKFPIHITSPAPNFKQFFILAGGLILVLAITGQIIWPTLALQLSLVCLGAVALISIGIAKHLEPAISIKLTENSIRYFHRYGQWKLDWSNINRIYIPRFYHQLEHREISYIGIKINDLEAFIDNVSPRFASRIIHEHRDILALAISQGDINIAQAQINLSAFKLPSGFEIKGPLAPFFHQMILLERVYGAHLFIPFSGLTMPPNDIINQMNVIRKMR
ncbi:MAG: DUF2982 domain-containing protein [Psychrobium sp.]